LGRRITNKRGGVSADFLDVRLEDGVRSNFQERNVLSAEFLNDLVEGGTEKHGLANLRLGARAGPTEKKR